MQRRHQFLERNIMTDIPLKHGVFLAPYHPVEESVTTWFQHDIELAQHLDRMGFDELWVGEHHSGGFETIASPELFIAAAAQVTRRLHFGTGVITLPYHNPLMVANRIAQLDHMTRGRVSFGFGPGLLMRDASMLGLNPSETRSRMTEALEIIMRLLKGEAVTHRSDWITLDNARAHLLPYTQPLPEFSVASAGTPSGGAAAGKYGLSMLCVAASTAGGFDVLGSNWQIAQEAAAANGHVMDPRKLRLVAPMHIAETREQARENVKHGLERWADYYDMASPNPFDRSGGDLVDMLTTSGRAVVGTPADAIAMIERLRGRQGQFGVFLAQHVDWADWDATRKSYELYARYVMPHFSRADQNRRIMLDQMRTDLADASKLRADAAAKSFADHAAATSKVA
jgi:limonene 1,2-monooxygenase